MPINPTSPTDSGYQSPLVQIAPAVNQPRTGETLLNSITITTNTQNGWYTLTPDPGIFYKGWYTASDDWFDTRNQHIKAALKHAAGWVQRAHYKTHHTTSIAIDWDCAQRAVHQHAMQITTTTAGTGNVFVHPLTATAGATTNHVLTWPAIQDLVDCDPWLSNGQVRMTAQQYAQHVARYGGVRPRSTGLHLQRGKNHRGNPLRSFDSDTMFTDANREEVTALHLLRSMVEQDQFRRYLKHGFIVQRGDSGLDYQIRRNATCQVWDKGTLIATLCVHLRLENRPAPPTDHVVGKMLIVQCDEKDFWKRANISWTTADQNRALLEKIGYTTEEIDALKKPDYGNGVSGSDMAKWVKIIQFANAKHINKATAQKLIAAIG